jgi:hypothetical protein
LAATAVSEKEKTVRPGKKKKSEIPPAESNSAPDPIGFKNVPSPLSMTSASASETTADMTSATNKRVRDEATPTRTAVEKKPRRRSKGEMPPSDDQFDSIRLEGKLTVLELVELISTRLKLVFLLSPIVSPFFLFNQMVLVELEPVLGLSKQVLKHAWEKQTVGEFSPIIWS